MFWGYFVVFTLVSVVGYFFLALFGSEVLGQLVIFLIGVAALAGLATALERLKEQAETLARLEEKLDRLLKGQDSERPGEHSGEDEL